MSIKLVTQSENAIELNCKFNGNIDLKAPIQQQAGGAVRYDTQQSLTDAQKLQARENIGAQDALNGFTAYTCTFAPLFAGEEDSTTTYYVKGEFHPIDYKTASEDVKTAWAGLEIILTGATASPKANKNNLKNIATLAKAGLFGDNYLSTYDHYHPIIIQTEPIAPTHIAEVSFGEQRKYVTLKTRWPDEHYLSIMQYYMEEDTFGDYVTWQYGSIYQDCQYIDDTPAVNQFKMKKDPTADMEVATKKYVDEKVNSASGSGSDIKSIALTTNTIPSGNTADYKEALTYLWGNGNAHSIDLSQCIITVDGVVVNYVYVHSPYIYFYVPISANFGYDNLRGLNKYYYFCNYTEAMAATSDYKYIKRADYAATLLTSDNYSQYISAGGATYTEDIGDSNLYNAKEVYIHIVTSDGRTTSINIRVPQNYVFGEKANDYYYFPQSESSNGYLWYDGSSFNISGSNYIDYIYYN